MDRRHAVLLILAGLAVTSATATVRAQVDQQTLARQILSADRGEQSRALSAAWALGPQNTGPELRAALITLLDRNNRIVAEAAKRDEVLENLINPEFVAHVAHVVSQLQDSQAIPALAGALGSGSTLIRDALADFGEQAAPAVLQVVTSPETPDDEIREGLLTLRFMVEGPGARPLSAGTRDAIRRAAKQRLAGKQYFTVLGRAIDLAVSLRDPELRRIVEALAANPDSVAARGIDDPELVELVQRQAASRLVGGPSRPHYRTPTERARLLDARRPQ